MNHPSKEIDAKFRFIHKKEFLTSASEFDGKYAQQKHFPFIFWPKFFFLLWIIFYATWDSKLDGTDRRFTLGAAEFSMGNNPSAVTSCCRTLLAAYPCTSIMTLSRPAESMSTHGGTSGWHAVGSTAAAVGTITALLLLLRPGGHFGPGNVTAAIDDGDGRHGQASILSKHPELSWQVKKQSTSKIQKKILKRKKPKKWPKKCPKKPQKNDQKNYRCCFDRSLRCEKKKLL